MGKGNKRAQREQQKAANIKKTQKAGKKGEAMANRSMQRRTAQQTKREERMTRKQMRKERERKKYSKREMEQLLERIRPLGLRIRDVDGDGNCLFRAASMELFGAEGRHLEIRENVVAFMMANPEDFAPFVEDDMSFAEYCASMMRGREWGGHLELQAMSLAYSRNIQIYRLDEPRWDFRNFPPDAPLFRFSYHGGNHYAHVHPIDAGVPLPPEAGMMLMADEFEVPAYAFEEDGDLPSEDEQMVMAATGLSDIVTIRATLLDMGGDVEATIQYFFALEMSGVVDDASSTTAEDDDDSSAPEGSTSTAAPARKLTAKEKRAEKERVKREKKMARRRRAGVVDEDAQSDQEPTAKKRGGDGEGDGAGGIGVEFQAMAI